MTNEGLEVLLVEDDPDDLELAVYALKEARVTNPVRVVRDGAEALDYIFGEGAYAGCPVNRPRVVLLDLKLPKVDGLQVLRRMKADPRTQGIPVVILTSSSEERDLIEGYRLGANSYIQKPVDFDQFRKTIGELGYYWLVVNQALPPAI